MEDSRRSRSLSDAPGSSIMLVAGGGPREEAIALTAKKHTDLLTDCEGS